ncbi:MAG: LptF/LptG family permease, partial [Pyrinomonadaceae bacterium]
FVAIKPNGLSLLYKYLVYLIPFIYVQIAPAALMIAALATYIIKSRQNEIVIWTASGRSSYRLLTPCLLLMIFIGCLNWGFQETLVPYANQVQDRLRTEIRTKDTSLIAGKVKNWVATDNHIYSFDLNQNSGDAPADYQVVNNLDVYEFEPENPRLLSFTSVEQANWENGKISFKTKPEMLYWSKDNAPIEVVDPPDNIQENYNPFSNALKKPSHLNSFEIKEKILTTESDSDLRFYQVALQKKYTTLFLPLLIVSFTVPFAISLDRKGNIATLGYAVGLWLVFMAATNFLEQYGLNGYLEPVIAVWTPLVIFGLIGVWLISRIKT